MNEKFADWNNKVITQMSFDLFNNPIKLIPALIAIILIIMIVVSLIKKHK